MVPESNNNSVMQYKVQLGEDKSVSDIIRIVRELQDLHKLVIDVDFQFAYFPTEDNFMTSHHRPRYTLFMFAEAKHATFFTLKYV